MPVVQVKMSDECHKALKQYAAFLGVPMGELLYRFARFGFHEQAHCCKWMNSCLSQLNIDLDKGSEKPCFGFRCNVCSNRTACRTGVYKGLFQIPESFKHLQTEHGSAVMQEMEEVWLSHKERCESTHCNDSHP
tara:strand:- start:9 stop:410 length:402 start_codon:yes stop_codon:yes gene_type:complete